MGNESKALHLKNKKPPRCINRHRDCSGCVKDICKVPPHLSCDVYPAFNLSIKEQPDFEYKNMESADFLL